MALPPIAAEPLPSKGPLHRCASSGESNLLFSLAFPISFASYDHQTEYNSAVCFQVLPYSAYISNGSQQHIVPRLCCRHAHPLVLFAVFQEFYETYSDNRHVTDEQVMDIITMGGRNCHPDDYHAYVENPLATAEYHTDMVSAANMVARPQAAVPRHSSVTEVTCPATFTCPATPPTPHHPARHHP